MVICARKILKKRQMMKIKIIRIKQFHVLLIEADNCIRAFHKLDSKLGEKMKNQDFHMAYEAEKHKHLHEWKEKVVNHINEKTREYAHEHFLLQRLKPYKSIKEVERHLKPSLISRLFGGHNG